MGGKSRGKPVFLIILGYAVFLGVSWVILMQIFRLTTYHRTFFAGLPLLLAFSIASGYVLLILRLDAFFLWHVVILAVLFVVQFRSQRRKFSQFIHEVEGDSSQLAIARLSAASTRAHYALSGVAYLLAFAISYLYFLNRALPAVVAK